MKILLLAMPDTGDWLDHVMRLPNLAMVSMAGSLPDHEVRVLDLVLIKENLIETLERHLDVFTPEMVGMSAMTFQYSTMLKLASYLKKRLPGVTIAAGGYHVTLMHREIADETPGIPVDFMVHGEGERTFAELVASYCSGGSMADIRGLSWRDGSRKWFHNPPRELLDLAELPLPDRSGRLENGFHTFRKSIDVTETSRGCPLCCNFCSIRKMYGSTFRRFPIERIVEDLRRLKAAGTEIVFLSDDNITYDVGHFSAICRAIMENGLNDMLYGIQASAYGIAKNPELVELMDGANIRVVNLGLESMDPDTLRFMKKATSIEINREAMRLLKAHKMGVNALFIVGFPEDTEQSIKTNFRNLMALKPDSLYCQFITPYPKTEVREQLLAAGLVENPDDYSQYDGYHCNIRTRHLTRKQLWNVFIRENIKSWWPQIKGGNYFLKHFFLGYLTCEMKVALTFLYRLFWGKARDWRLDLEP